MWPQRSVSSLCGSDHYDIHAQPSFKIKINKGRGREIRKKKIEPYPLENRLEGSPWVLGATNGWCFEHSPSSFHLLESQSPHTPKENHCCTRVCSPHAVASDALAASTTPLGSVLADLCSDGIVFCQGSTIWNRVRRRRSSITWVSFLLLADWWLCEANRKWEERRVMSLSLGHDFNPDRRQKG